VPAAKAQDAAYGMALEAIVNTTKSDPQREEAQALLERLKSTPQ
jgi:hypothetical protein